MNSTALDLLTDSYRNESFRQILPELPRRQKEVYEAVSKMESGGTIYEIAEEMKRPINLVVGRIVELKDKQLLRIVGSKPNPYSGKENSIYQVISPLTI